MNKDYNVKNKTVANNVVTATNATPVHDRKAEQEYSYYSKLLEKPFDSVAELREAEEAVRAAQRAKEDKAAKKKADAAVVEDAFRALNAARKTYKMDLDAVATSYREAMTRLKDAFEKDVARIKAELAAAEESYKTALKDFADKYPEGYHITLKDGDFETTIHRDTTKAQSNRVPDLFDMLFNLRF